MSTLAPATLSSINSTRSNVFKAAWTLVKEAGKSLSEALKLAWLKFKKVMETTFLDMTIEQLSDLKAKIEAAITAKQEKPKVEKVLFNPEDHFERYNGGWTKIVEGLDKKYTNGYSIQGEFTTTGKKDWYQVGKLFIDCGIGGSRKNQKKYYTLFTIDENATPVIIETAEGKDWATDLWESIEKYLSK